MVTVLMRKFLVVLSQSLFPEEPLLTITLATLIVFLGMIINTRYRPYLLHEANMLQFWCSVQAVIGCLCALVFYWKQFPQSRITDTQEVVVVVIFFVATLTSAWKCFTGVINEILSYRMWKHADQGFIDNLLNKPWFIKMFGGTKAQHWALSIEHRHKFETELSEFERSRVFPDEGGVLNQAMREGTLSEIHKQHLVLGLVKDRFGTQMELFSKWEPQSWRQLYDGLRRFAFFYRDATISSVFSERVDKQVVATGGQPSPVSTPRSARSAASVNMWLKDPSAQNGGIHNGVGSPNASTTHETLEKMLLEPATSPPASVHNTPEKPSDSKQTPLSPSNKLMVSRDDESVLSSQASVSHRHTRCFGDMRR